MRPPGAVVALAILWLAAACTFEDDAGHRSELRAGAALNAKRIVSLTPAVTETLVEIGAGDRIVGIDDHCEFPTQVTDLPRVGNAFSPNYEAIVSLRPDAIVTQHLTGIPVADLEKIAPTMVLPWTSLEEVKASMGTVGALVDMQEEAAALVRSLGESLKPRHRPDAPRVLLAFSPASQALSQVWFMKENSLHGRALEAGGARNAVEQAVAGSPVLSLERVLEIDPDMIIVLVDRKNNVESILRTWESLSDLRAVQEKEVHVLEDPGLYVPGPRIIGLSAKLERLIESYPSGTRDDGRRGDATSL